MKYSDLNTFLSSGVKSLKKGPYAFILVEDLSEVDTTIRHHLQAGFAEVLVFGPNEIDLPPVLNERVHHIIFDMNEDQATETVINAMIEAKPGEWMYYCYNAEYLFYPFSDARTVGEMLTFQNEERRDSILTYVIDLYAKDLDTTPMAVSLETAHLDKTGYYALARNDAANHNYPKERQLDFFGGLKWRFEEHIPYKKRKIDRISLFRSKPGLELRDDHTFNDEEYNTYACPWHNNVTAAICSFRTAKALKINPGSRFEINSFAWHNSVQFEWHSQQLLDLGLIEPGQWF
ncbi:glycosyltransferase family 2 protein [Cochlodiniinecator piscidefendens]|uniref:glycosyltransferase family 2 protein n=1 Tax=Cochlodiniinecator piscidefendens TaxID=2715756 RepID=UPI0014089180|nr:glycosyltransferase family 2 protein [Cochlodiniinecator piscidefendens]